MPWTGVDVNYSAPHLPGEGWARVSGTYDTPGLVGEFNFDEIVEIDDLPTRAAFVSEVVARAIDFVSKAAAEELTQVAVTTDLDTALP